MYAAPNSSLHPFRRLRRESERAPELLALKHTSRILGHSYMWFLHDGTGLTMCCLAHVELAWLFLEPDTGLDHCPRILLFCFRAGTSGWCHRFDTVGTRPVNFTRRHRLQSSGDGATIASWRPPVLVQTLKFWIGFKFPVWSQSFKPNN